jgi:hypothetical protein
MCNYTKRENQSEDAHNIIIVSNIASSLSTSYSPVPTGLLDATHTAPAVGLLDVQPIFLLSHLRKKAFVYKRQMERKIIPHQWTAIAIVHERQQQAAKVWE